MNGSELMQKYFEESSIKSEEVTESTISKIVSFLGASRIELNPIQKAYIRSHVKTAFLDGCNFQMAFDSKNKLSSE